MEHWVMKVFVSVQAHQLDERGVHVRINRRTQKGMLGLLQSAVKSSWASLRHTEGSFHSQQTQDS